MKNTFKARLSYYKWIVSYYLFDKFQCRCPKGHFPMKYNKATGEFDSFYSWKDILKIDETLRVEAEWCKPTSTECVGR